MAHDSDQKIGPTVAGSTNRDPQDRRYVCQICGWDYDEAEGDPFFGIDPGTKWEDLPETYCCPECGAGKEFFNQAPG